MNRPTDTARHFIPTRSGSRLVRIAGEGPPVVLLHQSPRSGAEHGGMFAALAAAGRTVIAPDTPGQGHSYALPARPAGGDPGARIDAFAQALIDLMDAMGVEGAPVYGNHTGAMIALRTAQCAPHRVTALVLNGMLAMDGASRADWLAHYLPPFAPRWDGGHLVWAWARLREQMLFFPWHRRDAAAAAAIGARDMPTPDALNAPLLDLLAAGEHYGDAYGAAIGWDGVAALETGAWPPVDIVTAQTDPLVACVPEVRARAPHARQHVTDDAEAARALAVARLVAAPPGAWRAGRAGVPAGADGDPALIAVPGGAVRVRRLGGDPSRPVVILHELAPSADGPALAAAQALGAHHHALVVETPGHGLSDGEGLADLEAVIARLAQATATAVPQGDLSLVGIGWGGALASGLARQLDARGAHRIGRLVLVRPRLLPDPADTLAHWLPDLRPDMDGAHLLRAWRFARDRRLFHPWYRGRAEDRTAGAPDLDERSIHRDAHDALRSHATARMMLAGLVGWDWGAGLQGLAGRTVLVPGASEGDHARAQAFAADHGVRLLAPGAPPADWL